MKTDYFHIGLDDTDSAEGMCTTFLTYELVRSLGKRVSYFDYPNLIRHNPNIPWKTRGNASLVLRLKTRLDRETLFSHCEQLLKEHATSAKANSGLVLLQGRFLAAELRNFSRRALYSVLSVSEAISLMEELDIRFLGLRSRLGLVGALAGIGNSLSGDHTYELIAYRSSLSSPRKLDIDKLHRMNASTFPSTFSNLDLENGRIMIMPHGPDPVLCGIRGESPIAVKRAFSMLLPIENCRGWMIFRSNQGTGEHLSEPLDLGRAKAFTSGKVSAVVSSQPRVEVGGHVFFTVRNPTGEMECACYEPSGDFRKQVLLLSPGDELELGGGVRKATSVHPKILNLEYFKINSLARRAMRVNPSCPSCGRATSSKGRGQAFECTFCGHRTDSPKKSIVFSIPLEQGKLYLPPVRAQRHLTKPLQRFARERKGHFPLVAGWASFC